MDMKEIGNFCKTFREEELCATLREVCEDTDTNVKTLSAFEHGRSNNIKHIFKYLKMCNEDQRETFIKTLFEVAGDLT